MNALARLTPASLNAEQSALYTAIVAGPRAARPQRFALTRPDGSLTGPFNALLHAPSVGAAVQQLGAAIRFGTELDDRVRELAILAVAADTGCRYEWDAHASVGRAIGISEPELEAIAHGRMPHGLSDHERACLAFVRAVLAGTEDTHPITQIPPSLQVELCTLVGYYRLLALYLRVFDADEPAVVPPE